jgi:hypothetical protein
MRLYRLGRKRWEVLATPDVLEFLEGLDKSFERARNEMLAILRERAPGEPPRQAPISRRLEGDRYEWRVNRLRVAWFDDRTRRRVIVCTNGDFKTTRKAKESFKAQAKCVQQRYYEAVRERTTDIHDLLRTGE